jgi:hypothetical protein
MIVTKIRTVGPTFTDFPFVGVAAEGPYLLKGADGLGPVEADVLSNGERRPHQRQIVLLIGLKPSWNDGQTSEQLRNALYGLMTPIGGGLISCQLMNNDTVVAEVEGQVSKMEIGVFTKDPEVQVTIDCLGATKSYFLAPNEVSTIPSYSGGAFNLNNLGDAPSGFQLTLKLNENVGDGGVSLINNQNVNAIQKMHLDGPFSANDTIQIDTRVGTKNVLWAELGDFSYTSILGKLGTTDPWIQLHGGYNVLHLTKTGPPETYLDADILSFKYTPAYWGV